MTTFFLDDNMHGGGYASGFYRPPDRPPSKKNPCK